MQENHHNNRGVLIALTVLTFFSIPHLIDDFLFDIPADFGITNQVAQFLSGIFAVLLVVTFTLVAKEKRMGYYLSAFVGGFLTLAVVLKHIPLMIKPGPYWSGWFSEGLIIGIALSGVTVFILSVRALRGISK